MIRMSSVFSYPFRSRRKALAITAGFSALLGLVALAALGPPHDDETAAAPAPAIASVARIAVAEAASAEGARSYSYYPEQLAALHSMSNFTPIADEGLKPAPQVIPTVTAARDAPLPPRVVRRADGPLKVAALAQPPAAAAQADPQLTSQNQTAQDHAKPKTKIFGVSLPGLPDLGQGIQDARDAATRWGNAAAGFGRGMAGFWR